MIDSVLTDNVENQMPGCNSYIKLPNYCWQVDKTCIDPDQSNCQHWVFVEKPVTLFYFIAFFFDERRDFRSFRVAYLFNVGLLKLLS